MMRFKRIKKFFRPRTTARPGHLHEPKYIIGQWYEPEELLQFDKPDAEAMTQLRLLLESARIAPYRAPGVLKTSSRERHIRGDLETIMVPLAEELSADYLDNAPSSHEWGGGFDYIVHYSMRYPNAIIILSHFFHLEQEGGFCFARRVHRISANEYVLVVNK